MSKNLLTQDRLKQLDIAANLLTQDRQKLLDIAAQLSTGYYQTVELLDFARELPDRLLLACATIAKDRELAATYPDRDPFEEAKDAAIETALEEARPDIECEARNEALRDARERASAVLDRVQEELDTLLDVVEDL